MHKILEKNKIIRCNVSLPQSRTRDSYSRMSIELNKHTNWLIKLNYSNLYRVHVNDMHHFFLNEGAIELTKMSGRILNAPN